MMRLAELLAFGGLALGLHLAAWAAIGETGSVSTGAQGDAAVSLSAASGEVSELVARWTAPLEAMQAQPDLSAPIEATGAALPAPAHEAQRPTSPTPKKPSVDFLATEPLPRVDTAPAMQPHAPRASLRPKTRPAERPPEPRPEPVTSRAPQSTGSLSQKAKGDRSGENAGDHGRQRPSTLSEADRQSLISQWGAAIRTAVERQKRFPRGIRASGTVVIRMSVTSAGRLAGARIIRSSGDARLDDAASTAVKRARFPAAPDGIDNRLTHFNLPLQFRR